MNTSLQSLNKTRRRSLRRSSVSPVINGASSDQEDAFESDGEDESDDELSDSSDEEILQNGDMDRMHTNQRNDKYPATTYRAVSSRVSSGNIVTPTSNVKKDRTVEKKHCVPIGSKFVLALTNAVQSYSSRMRIPLPSSPTITRVPSSESRPKELHEILSDESDLDTSVKKRVPVKDASEPREGLLDSPPIDVDAVMKLVYQPSEPWAGLSRSPIENSVVVAKLHSGDTYDTYIKQGLLDGQNVTYMSKVWVLSQEWEGFFSELALYSGSDYLRPLQGSVVPKIMGYYSVEGGISVAMELPSSEFWIEASCDMSVHFKRKCLSAFDAIHERGVLHNRVELRHILISSQGDVTITNFQNGRALKPITEVGMGEATEADIRLEKRKVRFKLHYEDSVAKEVERVNRRSDREARILRRSTEHGSPSGRPGESIPVPDGKTGPEYLDDELNPAVDAMTFKDQWLGPRFEPTCHIVPGQNKVQLSSRVHEFLMKELDILDKENTTRKATPIETSRSPATALTTTPILPTRIKLKRNRDDDDTGTPSPKRRFVGPSKAKVEEATTNHVLKAEASLGIAAPSTGNPSNLCTDPGLSSFSDLIPEIHVPYEGYTEPDGYVLPNTFSPEQLADIRKVWIQRYTMKRCIENNIPYPIAEMCSLTPNSLPKAARYDNNGNGIRRRKPRRSLGTLIRMQMSIEDLENLRKDATARREKYFRNRREPGTGLSDSEDSEEGDTRSCVEDDNIVEGPRILTWHQLRQLSPRDEKYCPVSSPPPKSPLRRQVNAEQSKPLKGILRRQLTEAEKARNIALLEDHKRKRDSDSDEDDDEDGDTEAGASFWRYLKRVRLDIGPLRNRNLATPDHNDRPQNRQNDSSPGATCQSNNRRVSSCGVALPYVSSFPKALARSPPPSVSSPSNSTLPGTHHDASPSETPSLASAPTDHFSGLSDLISDSDAPDGDQSPSSSVLPRTRERRHCHSQIDSDSTGGPTSAAPSSNKSSNSVEEKDKHIWGIPLTLPWRWPMSKK